MLEEEKQLILDLIAALQAKNLDVLKHCAGELLKFDEEGVRFDALANMLNINDLSIKLQYDKAQKLADQVQYQLLTDENQGEFRDFSECVRHYALQRPGEVAVMDDHSEMTWRVFDKRVDRVANGVTDLNLASDSRVGVLGETNIDYLSIMCGTLRSGYCIVPLPTMIASSSLETMGEDANLGLLFVCAKYRYLIQPFEQKLHNKIALDFEAEGWVNFHSWLKDCSKQKVDKTLDPDSEFDILYSSGTTGIPKGIVHSRRVRFNSYATGYRLGFWPGSTTYISTPLYSNTTLATVLRSFSNGSKLILTKKFEIEKWLQTAENQRVTHTVLVPVQLQMIMSFENFEKYDLSHFEWVLTTSAPLRPELKLDIVNRWPGQFLEIYGMTEGGVYSFLFANAHLDKLHTVGRPYHHILKVIDENGEELPQGEIGEMVGHGKTIMDGYHNREEATKEAFWYDDRGRKYLCSGDYGMIDEDGFVVLHGRKKEVIVSGGFNIYSVDLEEILKQHPSIKEAAVIGVPSEKWGESPLAIVEVVDGSELKGDEIKDWTNERLGKVQRLVGVDVCNELPRSPIGKVLKKELRKKYWGEK